MFLNAKLFSESLNALQFILKRRMAEKKGLLLEMVERGEGGWRGGGERREGGGWRGGGEKGVKRETFYTKTF